jgi:hypothetical protein
MEKDLLKRKHRAGRPLGELLDFRHYLFNHVARVRGCDPAKGGEKPLGAVGVRVGAVARRNPPMRKKEREK